MNRGARPDQRGSAGAVLTVGIALATAGVFVVAMVLIHWFAIARQAEQAAELAALAAVGAASAGEEPCPAAGRAASRNEVAVAECVVRGEGRHVVVEVSIRVDLTPALPGVASSLTRRATAATF